MFKEHFDALSIRDAFAVSTLQMVSSTTSFTSLLAFVPEPRVMCFRTIPRCNQQ